MNVRVVVYRCSAKQRNGCSCTAVPQGADTQKYDEVPDIPRLLTMIEEYLADYNAQVWRGGVALG